MGCCVEQNGGLRITVESVEDLMYGDFDEILHFGRIATEGARQRWLEDNGGIEQDKRRHENAVLRRTDVDVSQRSVTAQEVQDIIDETLKEEAKAKAEAEEKEKEKETSKKKK